MMRTATMSFPEIQPFVRYVQCLIINDETYPTFADVCPYDCRFFYVKSGRGRYRISGEAHLFEKGEMILFGSGLCYHISSAPEDPLTLLGVNFDYTRSFAHLTIPIPPVPAVNFRAEDALEHVEFTDFQGFNRPVHLKNMQILEAPMERMLREYKAQKLYCATQLSGLFADVLVTIGRRLSIQAAPDSRIGSANLDNVIRYIHEHYQEPLTNESIGEYLGYHPNYINQQMKLYTGKSLHQYLIQYRLSRAVDLLLATDLPVGDIARRVGFRDLCHFSRIFHRNIGCAPGQIRTAPQKPVPTGGARSAVV